MSSISFRTIAQFLSVALWLLVATLGTIVPAAADSVTLKSGEKIEGKIIVQGTDIVKIEVQISGSIKETKTFGMDEVAGIEKTAPDKVAFAAIQANIPTPDLMSSADYDDMIRSGARRFLTTYPESEHVAEVTKIIEQLEDEKERVQLGAIKLDGEWVSREDRQLYRFAVEARIRNRRMQLKMANKDILGALREFENIEERYTETPAHHVSLTNALKVLPGWIQNLERQLGNVEFLDKRDKDAEALLKPDELAQIQQAKAAEKAQFAQVLQNERDQDILWTSVNFRSSESLQNSISLAKNQFTRLSEIDAAALKFQSETLHEANRLIGEAKLTAARSKIAEATGASTKKSRRSKSGDSTTPTRYSQWLVGQIAEKEQALEEAAKAAAAKVAAAKASGTAAVVPDEDDKKADDEGDPEMDDKKDGEGEGEEAKPKTRAELIAAERARSEAEKAAEEAQKDAKKSRPKKRPSSESSDDEEAEEPEEVSSGGSFNPMFIVWGIAGLLIITLVVLKVMGIGGAKDDGGAAMDEGASDTLDGGADTDEE